MFKADKNTLILFLGGMKKNIADHRISCHYNHYEVNDSSLSRYEFSGGIPEVILCLGGFISHPSFNKWKEKATTFKIPFVVGGSGLGSLVEQARQQNIDLLEVIKVNGRATSEVKVEPMKDTSSPLDKFPPLQANLPSHYNIEFRDEFHPAVQHRQINDNTIILILKNKSGTYNMYLKSGWLDEADRLATKFGCDGTAPPIERFVLKDVAEKIANDFQNRIKGRGISIDFKAVQRALNAYRNAETPQQYKKTPRGGKGDKKEKPIMTIAAPSPTPSSTPSAPSPAPSLPPSVRYVPGEPLVPKPINIEEVSGELKAVLDEIRGKIHGRKSISGGSNFEMFLLEMVFHMRASDENVRDLKVALQMIADIRADKEKTETQYLNALEELQKQNVEIEKLKKELIKWKTLASQ